MASVLDGLKSQMSKAREEYKAKKAGISDKIRELESQSAALDKEYSFLDTMFGGKGKGRKAGAKAGVEYGGVKQAVLEAIQGSKNGIKPAQIAEKTGLASPQVHNSLTGLKKSKEVKVKDGLYHAT